MPVKDPAKKREIDRLYREKKKAERAIQEQAQVAGESVDTAEAARAVVEVREEGPLREYTAADLRDALEVGRCCRIWEEVVAGQTAGESDLAEWLESDPPLRWLFLAWVAASPWATEYQDWAEDRLSSGTA